MRSKSSKSSLSIAFVDFDQRQIRERIAACGVNRIDRLVVPVFKKNASQWLDLPPTGSGMNEFKPRNEEAFVVLPVGGRSSRKWS